MSKISIKPVLLILCAFMFLSGGKTYSQSHMISVGGGITKVLGEENGVINLGFNGAGYALFGISENTYIGGKIGYNHLSMDVPDFIKIASELDISASMSILEITPVVRLIPKGDTGSSPKFFLQIGSGLYNISATLSASYGDRSAEESESKSYFGFNLGVGVLFGNPENIRFEISPVVNLILTEEDTTKYLAVNLGVVF